MRHRHSGSYRSRTKRGRIVFKKRPIHTHQAFIKKYQPIVNIAKKKGYKVSDLDRKQSTVDEVDIPESYLTDGMIVPDKKGKERRDLIFIDDDAREDYKRRAFAHELGHQHMFATGQDDETGDSNIDKIEGKADKIGADILDMSVKEFNSPDVTYKDVVSGRRNFFFRKDEPIEHVFRNDEDPIDKGRTKEGRFLFPRRQDEE